MFDKILIANRGEIACRVIKTAQRLGIATVAVYSDADSDALHVAMADEAVHIGAAAARDSYLCIEKILAAATQTGAEAIHPGYGFLSENADFCRACNDAGIVFIGPPVEAIEAMGSKSAAKQIMQQAGVPLIPGYHGANQDGELLLAEAEKIEFPVLLKAVAGGGGKGMRQVHAAEIFQEQLAAARREALSSFGNADMLVEKYLTRPRHVEVQVFCDCSGAGVYLGDRDCSVQRRHQKVIEEAPAPGLDEALRRCMGESAVQAASAINYCGAGTVEFLLDEDSAFYFMEMNTRLQVEHPVTEMVTGQDLVEWQLRIATGAPLPLAQPDIHLHGHALEARIYAEDPQRDFLPATGTLAYLRTPRESTRVRVDSGVRQGDEIGVHYDPMIAKLIVWDEDRSSALRGLATALSEYRVAGLSTNIDFLYNIATCDAFIQADLDTGFIERHREEIFHRQGTEPYSDLAVAALYLLLRRQQQAAERARQHIDPCSPWHSHSGWRMNQPHLHSLNLVYREEVVEIIAEQLQSTADTRYRLRLGDQSVLASGTLREDQLNANIDGWRRQLTVAEHDGLYSAYRRAGAFQFALHQPDMGELANAGSGGNPQAPMNGIIVALLCETGQPVAADTPLLVMEAMKMEHTIRAPARGTVTAFYYQPGDLVDGDAELLDFAVEE